MSVVTSVIISDSAASTAAKQPAQKPQTNDPKNATDKAVQQLAAAKIPALKYTTYYTVEPNCSRVPLEEIFIPSFNVCYNMKGYAFFPDESPVEGATCTQIELDPEAVKLILTTATLAKRLLEESAKLKSFDDVIFP